MMVCEECSRSFGNERALSQHLNSKAHASILDPDEHILPANPSPFVTPNAPSFQPVQPEPMDFEDNPEKEVESLRNYNATSKLYVLTPIPGKGQGLIAVQDISKGTRILSDKPLFRIPRFGLVGPAFERAVAGKLHRLSKDDQMTFLSLHSNTPGGAYPLISIVKTSALPLGTDALEGGLFPEASRINHACVPNCQHTWNDNIGEETIHAVRQIFKGEEITISYANTGPFASRRRILKESFEFECTCELCSLPAAARAVSDNRQCEIQRLDDRIGDGFRLVSHPDKCLEDVHNLLTLLEAENITDARVPRAYYDAFQVAVAHGDQARARKSLCSEGV